MKVKRTIALAVAMVFVFAAAMTVFAKTDVFGKYTCTLTKSTSSSYYTMNVKMRVTNGTNSGESMTVRLRPLKSDGNYAAWQNEQAGNNAVEIVTSSSAAYVSGYRGWQAGYKSPSLGKEWNLYLDV